MNIVSVVIISQSNNFVKQSIPHSGNHYQHIIWGAIMYWVYLFKNNKFAKNAVFNVPHYQQFLINVETKCDEIIGHSDYIIIIALLIRTLHLASSDILTDGHITSHISLAIIIYGIYYTIYTIVSVMVGISNKAFSKNSIIIAQDSVIGIQNYKPKVASVIYE